MYDPYLPSSIFTFLYFHLSSSQRRATFYPDRVRATNCWVYEHPHSLASVCINSTCQYSSMSVCCILSAVRSLLTPNGHPFARLMSMHCVNPTTHLPLPCLLAGLGVQYFMHILSPMQMPQVPPIGPSPLGVCSPTHRSGCAVVCVCGVDLSVCRP